jgi:hypothetical protein
MHWAAIARISPVTAFSSGSLAVIVLAFCLYKWAGLGVAPLVVAVVGRLVVSVWIWSGGLQ